MKELALFWIWHVAHMCMLISCLQSHDTMTTYHTYITAHNCLDKPTRALMSCNLLCLMCWHLKGLWIRVSITYKTCMKQIFTYKWIHLRGFACRVYNGNFCWKLSALIFICFLVWMLLSSLCNSRGQHTICIIFMKKICPRKLASILCATRSAKTTKTNKSYENLKKFWHFIKDFGNN